MVIEAWISIYPTILTNTLIHHYCIQYSTKKEQKKQLAPHLLCLARLKVVNGYWYWGESRLSIESVLRLFVQKENGVMYWKQRGSQGHCQVKCIRCVYSYCFNLDLTRLSWFNTGRSSSALHIYSHIQSSEWLNVLDHHERNQHIFNAYWHLARFLLEEWKNIPKNIFPQFGHGSGESSLTCWSKISHKCSTGMRFGDFVFMFQFYITKFVYFLNSKVKSCTP